MIRNREILATGEAHALVLDCIEHAIEAAGPETATRANVAVEDSVLTVGDSTYDLDDYREVLVVGGGKAAGGVLTALESVLGDRITDGLLVTKHSTKADRVRYVVGDHPLPSARNVKVTAELLDLVRSADAETLVLFVVTGGTSALLTAPVDDISLGDLRETTDLLLASGAPIDEVNAVRKHLSDVKGGQIARTAAPATVVTLVLSDVVSNNLSAIGSGPTVPDETTIVDARAVFDRYDLDTEHLSQGVVSEVSETPFADDPVFDDVSTHLIGDNALALDAARSVANDAGYKPVVLTSRLRGEAREVGMTILAVAEEVAATGDPVEPPAVILAGGECTVSTAGNGGQGGPNQELVLASALELDGSTVVAAVDTDGEDGSSNVAGAIADAETVTNPNRARKHLDRNDAGTYLSDVDATIQTGPTGTNVNDVVVAVVPERTD